jgi:ribosomal protein L16/L10AE
MGKGKGNFLRWVFRLQQGLSIVEFLGIPIYRILKVVNFINKRLKLKLVVKSNNVLNHSFAS